MITVDSTNPEYYASTVVATSSILLITIPNEKALVLDPKLRRKELA